MTMKENYLRLFSHEPVAFTPVFFACTISCGFGASTGPSYEKGPNGSGLDGFGVRWVAPASGNGAPTPAPNSMVVDSVCDWEDITFPDLDKFDWAGVSAKELAQGNRDEQVVDFGMGNGIFERALACLGTEEALCAFYEEPEALNDFFTAVTDYKIRELEYIKKYYNPDIVTNYDDIATNASTFMSADLYRELVKPHHTRLHKAIQDMGMHAMFHCCGKCDNLVEDFIETGAEVWTSVQTSNDIVMLGEKYGDRIGILGGLDSTGRAGMPDATEEDVRAETRHIIETYGNLPNFGIFGPLLVASDDPAQAGWKYGVLMDEYFKILGPKIFG